MDFRDRAVPNRRPGAFPPRHASEGPAVVPVPVGTNGLPGVLVVPPHAVGVMVFPESSGDGGNSIPSRAIAHGLHEAGLATLLFDLLTPAEADDRDEGFDLPFLAGRLVQAVRWLAAQRDVHQLPIGLFGASTGAVALWAAAELGTEVSSVVCWSGRPELAAPRLADVTAPTLLIVGGRDREGLERNLEAQGLLHCPTYLRVVPGATQFFMQPGALDDVQATAIGWFTRHITTVHVTCPAGELV